MDNDLCAVCTDWLNKYMLRQRARPVGNSIEYWEKFVEDLYDNQAIETWCFASCNSNHDDVIVDFKSKTQVTCSICKWGSRRNSAKNAMMLPKLLKAQFDDGCLYEFLRLDPPETQSYQNGGLVVDYKSATRYMVYKDFQVAYYGSLRIVFTDVWKILTLEFCVQDLIVIPATSDLASLKWRVADPYVGVLNSRSYHHTTSDQEEDIRPELGDRDILFGDPSTKLQNDASPTVNQFVLTQEILSEFQRSRDLDVLKCVMDISIQYKFGPIESLESYLYFEAHRSFIQREVARENHVVLNQPPANDRSTNAP